MATITKAEILKAASAFNQDEKEKGLQEMRKEFQSILEESMETAKSRGKDDLYRKKYIHIPGCFNGVAPYDFLMEMKEAGFGYEYKDGCIVLK